MRWPWRRRRGGRVVFIGTSPFDVAQVIASVPTHSPVVSAWVPDEPVAGDAPEPAYAGPTPAAPTVHTAPAPATPANPAALGWLADLAELATELGELDPAVPAPAAQAPNGCPERLGVQLGFADGTVMTLDDDDPRAVALRAAAARLTGGE